MEIKWPWKKAKVEGNLVKIEPREFDSSDAMRVQHYIEDGGEIVDLSNRDRLPNDGFASDGELMHPWNRAHTGTKDGLSQMGKGGRR